MPVDLVHIGELDAEVSWRWLDDSCVYSGRRVCGGCLTPPDWQVPGGREYRWCNVRLGDDEVRLLIAKLINWKLG